jgi:hypothetical protein
MLTYSHPRGSFVAVLVALLLVCLGLAACGGSAGGSQGGVVSASAVSTTGRDQAPSGPPIPARGKRLSNPAFRQTLTKFVVCLQKHGAAVPTPSTSGSGPVLNTKAIDTSSAKFKAAWARCRGSVDLGSAFNKPEVDSKRPYIGALRGAG